MDYSISDATDFVGDIPRDINRRMYDPARIWRFTGNPLGHGGLWFIGNPAGGSEERQDPVAQRAVYGRPDHAMVGRFKRKCVRNIYFTRKTRTCIRFVLEGRLVLILIGLHM